MVNKELIDYIKSVKEKGFTDEAIKSSLLQYNYSQDVIDEAFRELISPAQPELRSVQPQKIALKEKNNKSGFPIVLLVLLVILFLGIGAFAVWKFVPFEMPALPFGSSACKNVSVDFYHIKGEPVVCVFPDNSKVQLILFNNGDIQLSKVDITVSGSKGNMYDIVENINLKSQDVFTRAFNYNYSEAGDIKSVSLLPYVSSNGRIDACGSKKITYDKIATC
jgi:hypothetical protein